MVKNKRVILIGSVIVLALAVTAGLLFIPTPKPIADKFNHGPDLNTYAGYSLDYEYEGFPLPVYRKGFLHAIIQDPMNPDGTPNIQSMLLGSCNLECDKSNDPRLGIAAYDTNSLWAFIVIDVIFWSIILTSIYYVWQRRQSHRLKKQAE